MGKKKILIYKKMNLNGSIYWDCALIKNKTTKRVRTYIIPTREKCNKSTPRKKSAIATNKVSCHQTNLWLLNSLVQIYNRSKSSGAAIG